MWHEVKSIFHIIIIFQCIIFSTYLLGYKDIKKTSKWILLAFLIVKIITEAGGFFGHFLGLRTLLLENAPLSLYISYPFRLAYIPFIYLYIVSITKKEFTFNARQILHFIPFILTAIYILVKYESLDPNLSRELIDKRELLKGLDYNLIKFTEYAQFFCYAIISLFLIHKYRIRIKFSYSSLERIYLSWPYIVIWGLICWKFLQMADYLLYISFPDTSLSILYIMYITAEISFLVFVSLLFLKGLKQPNVFFGIIEESSKEKYEKTGIPEISRKRYEQQLIQYMEQEKPYLDPILNIKELATGLSIPVHHLSQVINSSFNKNFYDFINSYRIEESKRLLTHYTAKEKTILEVLYDCGFNSKSVFNTAFKKHTGLTPTQFREKVSIKAA